MEPKPLDSYAVLAQFNQLMKELLGLGLARYTFQPWEIEILLDLESWKAPRSKRGPILRRYRTTVRRHMQNGAKLPLKFSEFLRSPSVAGPDKICVQERVTTTEIREDALGGGSSGTRRNGDARDAPHAPQKEHLAL